MIAWRAGSAPAETFGPQAGFTGVAQNRGQQMTRRRHRKSARAGILAALLATAAIAVLAGAPAASASTDQITILDPTPSLLNGETAARRSDILDRLQALGVDSVRILGGTQSDTLTVSTSTTADVQGLSLIHI